jgi:hypothetical protein
MVLCGLSGVSMSHACLIYFVLTHFLQTNNVIRNGGLRVCKFGIRRLLFYSLGSVGSLVSEKKIFEISANQSILLALAAILNIRLERKTVTL